MTTVYDALVSFIQALLELHPLEAHECPGIDPAWGRVTDYTSPCATRRAIMDTLDPAMQRAINRAASVVGPGYADRNTSDGDPGDAHAQSADVAGEVPAAPVRPDSPAADDGAGR